MICRNIYLIVLRKLTAQERKHNGKDQGVDSSCRTGSLTGSQDTTWAWGKGQNHTWGEQNEEEGWDYDISLGEVLLEHDLHQQIVDEHEQNCIDEQTLAKLVAVLASKPHETGVEQSKENGWDKNLLACNISHLHFTVRKYKNLHKTNQFQGSCEGCVHHLVYSGISMGVLDH